MSVMAKIFARIFDSERFNYPLLRRYSTLIHEDLSATYSRDIQKWLLIAPIIGVVTGLVITLITLVILNTIWARMLPFYLRHHWTIIPGLAIGFFLTGVIMQYRTRDPNEHSSEEIIRSYHEHQGDIAMKPFWWKLLAAVTTVGSGGSAALEGPSIYAGGAIGSWLWTKLARFGLTPRDRRLMLISGAGAGMAAVFRAPLTGLVFALEMPYKDDLAHEALLPSLIAAVVSYATLASILGPAPLFGFAGSTTFRTADIFWSAILGLGCGLISMVFTITFRRARHFAIHAPLPHTLKLVIGGVLTGVCGVIFVAAFPGGLIPIGTNYEAVRDVLAHPYPPGELCTFAFLKLCATLFSLGAGGVSAMFVPLFLTGGALGSAFAQAILHTPAFDLYAAVGMASFIAAGYKAPLTAVIFVAETTGGHAYIIPSLIGAACAYAISGEASASGDQRMHEMVKLSSFAGVAVREVMQRHVVSVSADTTIRDFATSVAATAQHTIFPVSEDGKPIGTIGVWALGAIAPEQWESTHVGEAAHRQIATIAGDRDVAEALRMLAREDSGRILFVTAAGGVIEGIVTRSDILRALQPGGANGGNGDH
ncbi:MAG: chloride channel protein [Candidatus Binataceae bacterium]|nr:chloride channel protein [Candidatus Binataceae bacterium]